MIIILNGLYRKLSFTHGDDPNTILMEVLDGVQISDSVIIPAVEWARLMDAGMALLIVGKEE